MILKEHIALLNSLDPGTLVEDGPYGPHLVHPSAVRHGDGSVRDDDEAALLIAFPASEIRQFLVTGQAPEPGRAQ